MRAVKLWDGDEVLVDAVYGRGAQGKKRSLRKSARFYLGRARFYRDEAIYWSRRAFDLQWLEPLRTNMAKEAVIQARLAVWFLRQARAARREAHLWR